MTTKKHVNVMGYLASNFVNINEKVPALIINPEATPLDLLAWCWGEITSLQAALEVLASSDEAIEPDKLSGIFLHRIEPLACVMHEAMDMLIEQKRSKTGGAS